MIEFQNVSVNFKQKNGNLSAVDNISFRIERGEIFGIIGSSGAGKSTLLRTINHLQEVSSGNVIVDGKNVTKYKGALLREHRTHIGMIFQHFNLADNLTVYQNVAFAVRSAGKDPKEADAKVREYLALTGISEKVDVYPSKLSGGQKQRVAISRALAGGAKILLCDEPTSALDTETTASILNLIRSLSKQFGITVVIITHELEVIKSICSRCAVMDDGKLAEIGGVYDVFTNPQSKTTKQLIGSSLRHDLPQEVLDNTSGLLVKLTFLGGGANLPVISGASLLFGVHFNILIGRIEYIEDKPLGILYVNPVGEAAAVQKSLEFLKQQVKEVEVINL